MYVKMGHLFMQRVLDVSIDHPYCVTPFSPELEANSKADSQCSDFITRVFYFLF